ncbi:beta-galactosidase [Actinoallomurus rhizosphaericola]|uniref:beta-galactosidase n=1 Tax=Actinoallomurus rhizosphaericola TaxID=2952536 RepID=UPI002092F6A9|nr:beta-galactosidase [Actinoallomurus rhizosphaericola]MCO5997311.1 beta-galactosidase [Actinoallomurus rhizosphaericola]
MNRIAGLRDRVGIAYGGDYNPEQWPEEVWDEDVRLMREAGVSLVSVGIFSWASVEPRPGEYDFGWLDRVLDRLAEGGVAACLATMTASPPPWLTTLHPEMLTVRADGSTISPGGRQHYCPSSPVYREHAVRLAEQVATRYAGHSALAVWHVNNEYGNVIPCHCDVSAVAFRRWLADRYGSVDELNDAWSTRFWAQGYGSFDEVLPPRSPAPFTNPAQELDYARFTSDELLACYRAEKEVLDRITPDVPVTTNFPPSLRPVDQWTWAPHLDVIAYDAYPDPLDPDATAKIAFSYDVMRSLRDGQPWLLMEQAPGAVNWRPRNAPKPRGAMRLWSWQAVAHGADAVMFFQWRQARGGAEKFHSAMVPHGGPSTRIFGEVRDLGRELAASRPLAGARAPRADAAMVLDWPSWWALEGPAHPSADVRFLDAAWACHRPLYDAGVACDVVRPDTYLSGYRLVVVPNLYLTSEAAARNLERYVEEGGTLVMSFFSGIVDPCDRVHLGGYPAPFRRMLGLTVEEFHPLAEDASVGLPGGSGTLWSEEVRLEGAEAVERFTTGVLAGEPAVTRHRFGRGDAWYLATRPDPATMRRLFDRVREEAGVAPVLPGLPDGVQARARDTEDGRWYVVLNHGTEPADVRLPTAMHDELSGAGPATSVRLEPRGVAVLRPA